MPRKDTRKSSSVNDIPVAKTPSTLLHSLDDTEFKHLLTSVSEAGFRNKPTLLNFKTKINQPPTETQSEQGEDGDSEEPETHARVKVCAKALFDEDAAARELERQRRRDNNKGLGGGGDRSISSSPDRSRVNYTYFDQDSDRKPVEFDDMNFDYIDEGNDVHSQDVEMVDLSTGSSPRRFVRGNREETVPELGEGDADPTRAPLGYVNDVVNSHRWPLDPDEASLINASLINNRGGDVFSRKQTVLAPQSEGMFSSLSYDVVGTDEVPDLNPTGHTMHNYQHQPQIQQQQVFTPWNNQYRSNEVNNRDMNNREPMRAVKVRLDESGNQIDQQKATEQPAIQSKSDVKRKGKQKKKERGITFVQSDSVSGFMGGLPIDEILRNIEGELHIETKSKKSEPSTDEKKRRKSKDVKESAVVVASDVATMGNQQAKAPCSQQNGDAMKNGTDVDTASSTNTTSATTTNHNNNNVKVQSKKQSPRRRKSGASAATVTTTASSTTTTTTTQLEPVSRSTGGRVSTEDGDEEFLSADEGLTIGVTDDQLAECKSSELMLDGANYRADDEDIGQLSLMSQTDENDFIPVAGKGRKRPPTIAGAHAQPRPGSAGKNERVRGAHGSSSAMPFNDRLTSEATRRNSLGHDERSKQRRPTTSLADFIDDKKTSPGGSHGKSTTSLPQQNLKGRRSVPIRADSAPQELDLDDDMPALGTPGVQNGTSSPDRVVFSYADAAKKSQEQSRECSPAMITAPTGAVSSPSPQSRKNVPEQGNPLELPEVEDAGASSGVSFFYDAEADANANGTSAVVDDGALVLNLGGNRTIRFAKGDALNGASVVGGLQTMPDERSLHIYNQMLSHWNAFCQGTPPRKYETRTAKAH